MISMRVGEAIRVVVTEFLTVVTNKNGTRTRVKRKIFRLIVGEINKPRGYSRVEVTFMNTKKNKIVINPGEKLVGMSNHH